MIPGVGISQGYLPAKASVGSPDWLPKGVKVKVMDISASTVSPKIADNKKRFADMFGG